MKVAASAGPPAPTPNSNPYPGLRPFREDEEHLFFGRERQVDAMVDKLRETGFLAVVGSSGSGKSSLVNCGLRPALLRGMMQGAGTAWRCAQFRPGNRVMRALAAALCAKGALYEQLQSEDFSPAALVESTLRSSRLGLVDAYHEAHLPSGTPLLVVVDQFEELFRYRGLEGGAGANHGPSADAVAFINLLLAAREEPQCPVYIVITMRSDFLGDCAQFHGLPEVLNAGQYLVPRMTRDQRRMAISGPAGVEGGTISPLLLTRLVNDVGDNPDQLSILQHALNRTWNKWEDKGRPGGEVQLEHYVEAGTMDKALDDHAERAFNEVGDARKPLARRVLQLLTDRGTDARGIRRPTTFGTLREITQASAADLLAVLEVFRKPSRSFLLPPQGEPVDDATVIDISHESLMRVWKQLQAWGDEEADSAQMLRRVADAARNYPAHESLWVDPKLRLALEWQHSQQPNEAWARLYGVKLAPVLQFLQESRTARDAAAAAQEQAVRDAEQRARRRRLRLGASVAAGVLGSLLFLNWYSRSEVQRLEQEAKANESRLVLGTLFDMLQDGNGKAPAPPLESSAAVPELRGRTLDYAMATLRELKLGSETSEVLHSARPGTVLDQFPRPPTRLELAEPLYLVVATSEAAQKAAKAAVAAAPTPAPAAAAASAASAPVSVVADAAASPPTPAGAEAPPSPTTPPPSPRPPAPAAVPLPAPATATATAPAPAPTAAAAALGKLGTGVNERRTGAAAAAPERLGLRSGSINCTAGNWTEWMSNAQFQARSAEQKRAGNMPSSIRGRWQDGRLEFSALFVPRPESGSFNWDIYRLEADLRTLKDVRGGKQNLRLLCAQSFTDAKGDARWQLTWASTGR